VPVPYAVIVVPVVTPLPERTDPMNREPDVTEAMVNVVVVIDPVPVKEPDTDSACGDTLMSLIG
jgi:hypothetical protein